MRDINYVDDVIQAKVINVSREDKKIGLSIRKMDESEEKDNFKGFSNNNMEAKSNLGDILREEMLNLQKNTSEEDSSEGNDSDLSEAAAEEPISYDEEVQDSDEGSDKSVDKTDEETPQAEESVSPDDESSDSDTSPDMKIEGSESEAGDSSEETQQETTASA